MNDRREQVDVAAELQKRARERQERLKTIADATATPKVRVIPKNDTLRKILKHGATGRGFPAEGSVEWPLDQFTKRRIRDGDITIEGEKSAKEIEQEQSNLAERQPKTRQQIRDTQETQRPTETGPRARPDSSER